MHSTIALCAATLFASVGLAAPVARADGYFYTLQVTSTDGSGRYSSNTLAACHAGAAIEALCVYDGAKSDFTFLPGSAPNTGFLQYDAPANGNETQTLAFLTNGEGTDNVQPAYFGGTTLPPVELAYQADSQELGVYVDAETTSYNWYVCPYNFEGYDYQTISFVANNEKASDAACSQVAIQRIELI